MNEIAEKLHFCSVIDSGYLSRAVLMYESLKKTGVDFHLYIFTIDERAQNILTGLALDSVTAIPVEDVEDAELLRVKPGRTVAEYCWTLKSPMILYLMKKFGIALCTYLDGDLYFYSSPAILRDEMGNASILLTPHRYTPNRDLTNVSGIYCAQYLSFKNDAHGREALQWWRSKCIEWCFSGYHDGKSGDQMYLDDWLTRFHGVHELEHPGGGLGPWNVQQYSFQLDDGRIVGIEKRTQKQFEVVFYHFHFVRFLDDGYVELGDYNLSKDVIDILYVPYLRSLESVNRKIQSIDGSFDPRGTRTRKRTPRSAITTLKRIVLGRNNIFRLKSLLA